MQVINASLQLKKKKENSTESKELLNLEEIPVVGYGSTAGMYEHALSSDKEYRKFIFKIESLIRSSPELRRYIKYLGSEVNMNKCALLSLVNSEDTRIEIHHYPFTLFDLVDIVIQHHIKSELNFTSFTIAASIVKLHFENLIGLVPLSKTVHELAHSGEVFINLKHVFGDFRAFIQQYHLGLNDDYTTRLSKLISMSLDENTENVNKVMLEVGEGYLMSGDNLTSIPDLK